MFNIQEIQEVKNPIKLFNEPNLLKGVIVKIKTIAKESATGLDVAEARDRKTIASVAAKVAKSKVFLDSLGKGLVADLKKQTGSIDAQRRELRNNLDAIKEEVRKPLTDWEIAEQERFDKIQERIEGFMQPFGETVREIKDRIAELEAIEINNETFGEYTDKAELTKDAAILRATQALTAAKQAVEDERKRKEREIQLQKERDKKIADQAAERAKREAQELARITKEKSDAKIKQAEEARKKAELKTKEVIKKQQTFTPSKTFATTATVNKTSTKRSKIVAALINETGVSAIQADLIIIKVVAGRIPYMHLEDK